MSETSEAWAAFQEANAHQGPILRRIAAKEFPEGVEVRWLAQPGTPHRIPTFRRGVLARHDGDIALVRMLGGKGVYRKVPIQLLEHPEVKA